MISFRTTLIVNDPVFIFLLETDRVILVGD